MTQTEVHVTGMNIREYTRVFGSEGTVFQPEDMVVDLGSGTSDLAVLPVAAVVQVDPAYSNSSQVGNVLRLSIALGEKDRATKEVIDQLCELKPTRVTLANALRYIDHKKRLLALEQALRLGEEALLQIYPVRSSAIEPIIDRAEQLSFDVFSQSISLGGLRQVAYKAMGLNNAICIDNRANNHGSVGRTGLAKALNSYLL